MKKFILLIMILLGSLSIFNCTQIDNGVVAEENPLLGRWSAGVGSFTTEYEYKSDNTYNMTVLSLPTSGVYEIDGNKLDRTITKTLGTDIGLESRVTEHYTFNVENDTLYIYGTGDNDGTIVEKLAKQ